MESAKDVQIQFASDSMQYEAVIDRIFRAHHVERIPVWIGLDGDDILYDMTGEMDRILNHFIYSGVGNYLGFRTQIRS